MLDKLLKSDLRILEYSPLQVSLPKGLQKKKAVINIKNKDEKCFLWSVIVGLYGDKKDRHSNRVYLYVCYEKDFNLQGISFPMTLTYIPKFKRRNNVSISVYGHRRKGQDGFVYSLKFS